MTPKEKAKEIFNQYWDLLAIHDVRNRRIFTKQCALIAVDEMLSNNVLKHRTCGYDLITSSHVEYWNQVKHEINNL